VAATARRPGREFGTDLLLQGIKRDGAPHTVVGVELDVECRVGRGTS
jgi:hypothetical protein